MEGLTYEEFLSLFPERPRRRTSTGWLVICPCHDDHDPSLHVSQTVDGKILCYCFACKVKSVREVLSCMGLRGWEVPVKWRFLTKEPQRFPKEYEIYDYVDENGRLLYQKIRLLPGKDFRFRRVVGEKEFEWNLTKDGRPVVRRVLYNLPEVMKAERVFVVEGEKDVETLRGWGLVGTTNDVGAGKWEPEFSEVLRGKEVVIIPDNDEAGWKHALLVARSCFGKAKEVKIVDLKKNGLGIKMEEGEDVTDFKKKGGTKEELLRLVEEAPTWTPAPLILQPPEREVYGTTMKLRFKEANVAIYLRKVHTHSDGRITCIMQIELGGYRLPHSGAINLAAEGTRANLAKRLEAKFALPWEEILERVYEEVAEAFLRGEPARFVEPKGSAEVEWLVEDLLPYGLPTVLWGEGGSGKSFLALLLARSIWNGGEFLGKEVRRQGKTLYLDWETNEEEMGRRLAMLGEAENDFLIYRRPYSPLDMCAEEIYEDILEFEPELIVVDSMSRAMGGSLIEAEPVLNFFRTVESFKKTTLIIHHPPKNSKEAPYGSVFAINAPRCVWMVKSEWTEEGTLRGVLIQTKTNVGKRTEPIGFEMEFEDRLRIWRLAEEEARPTESVTDMILSILKSEGPKTAKELAERLEISANSVRALLVRLERKGAVEKLGRKPVLWMARPGLFDEEGETAY